MNNGIVDVERTHDGIIVSFEDGLTVFYSAQLMRTIASHGEVIPHDLDLTEDS